MLYTAFKTFNEPDILLKAIEKVRELHPTWQMGGISVAERDGAYYIDAPGDIHTKGKVRAIYEKANEMTFFLNGGVNREYYTLRADGYVYSTSEGRTLEYPTYEAAYAEMVNIYNSCRQSGIGAPLYGIWKTTIWQGNEMTKPVWAA